MQQPRSVLVVAFGLALALSVTAACDGRSRVIKAEMSEVDANRYDRGRALSTPCWSCHDFYQPNFKVGPPLFGVVGRRAGAVEGFPYSEAMRRSGITWTLDTLRVFLGDIAGTVPGTTMVSPSLARGRDLDALVFYIQHATSEP